MFVHSSRDYRSILSLTNRVLIDVCNNLKIPRLRAVEESPSYIARAGEKATYLKGTNTVVISRQLLDAAMEQEPKTRVWYILSAIRHEIAHLEQWLRGVRNFTLEHEAEATLAGREFADNSVGKMSEEEINPVRSLYSSFHGANPTQVREISFEAPKPGEKLIAIGRVTQINYRPYGSSRRKGTEFFHKMGDTGERMNPEKPILAVSQDGKRLYLIRDESKMHFTARGIIS